MKNHITENGCVIYVPEHAYIDLKCDGFFSYEEVVALTEYACEMLRFYNLSKCAINLQHIKIYPSGAEEYLRDIWYRRLVEAGVNRIAYVVPEDIFGRASMTVVHAGEAASKIQRKYFGDESSAKEWLNSEL
ncbi:hypothetical protein ACFQ21_25780 [Ohtaekwangia kribbensis]|jgi:hypothetical protein|uniref:STAS/SEC14 domain-containing protein n=1 Tax=Ohtaekwangia kribbensis TaxID=688913 RepID=A0ABW3KCR8_9BACT